MFQYGLTGLNEVTTSGYRGLFLDITKDSLLKKQDTTTPSPFNRKLSSKYLSAVKTYNNDLQNISLKKI